MIMWGGPLEADEEDDKAIVKTTLLPSPCRQGGMYTPVVFTLTLKTLCLHLEAFNLSSQTRRSFHIVSRKISVVK